MIYHKKLTQEQRILNLLRERGSRGAYVYEFMTPRPNGLGIAQYNARIYGLREKGYVIENKKPLSLMKMAKEGWSFFLEISYKQF